MRKATLLILLLLTLTFTNAEITITVKGFGATEAEATQDALRNAVEQGAGVKIFSQSLVKNFVALKDAVICESLGLITGYTRLGRGKQGDLFWVEIQAKVARDVSQKWEQIKVILEQKGRPSIMFMIQESVDNQPTDQNLAEDTMRDKFIKLGFQVFGSQLIPGLTAKRKKLYSMDQNIEGITSLVSKNGAQLLLKGMLKANFVGNEDFYGIQYLRHRYVFSAGVYRTDTGQQIASTYATDYTTKHLAQLNTREMAAKDGFHSLTRQNFLQQLVNDIVVFWIRDIQEGTAIELVISNVKFGQRKKILERLENFPNLIRSVQVQHYRNRRLTFNVKSKLTTNELAGKLEQIKDLPLEVVELQRGWIELKYTGN